ncbi:MAG: glutamate synthase large subunit [Acidimicrobiaceae bacterium]|nr:glutamate synthase large subunit [Acidimicrobiaceae bacterium]
MSGCQGLYDPHFEHDSCGIGFICNINGVASHDVVSLGLQALCNLEHRGALGADIRTGDGAGILIQMPDSFLREVVDYPLPPVGHYATGIGFLPSSSESIGQTTAEVERIVRSEGLKVIGWREVPVDPSELGSGACSIMPSFCQIFIAGDGLSGIDLERRVYMVRKRIEQETLRGATVSNDPITTNDVNSDTANRDTDSPSDTPVNGSHSPSGDRSSSNSTSPIGAAASLHAGVYFPSLSTRTLVYKGMLTERQLPQFYPDLLDERVESAIALVHSRFSTNTLPSWSLAHPFRLIVHNGEINTIRGNRNWMHAREALMESPLLEGLERVLPVCTPGLSDTANLDEVVELLSLGGYSLPEAILMMIPEPWEHHLEMSAERRAFYRYNANRIEPWDGPAAIMFTDGAFVGAMLDRNGLRPSRYLVTDNGLVVMASETGVIDIDQASIIQKGRLSPGRMFLIDTREGRIIHDDEVKNQLADAHPYQQWLEQNIVNLHDLPKLCSIPQPNDLSKRNSEQNSLLQQQQMFGHTLEEHRLILAPMAAEGKEPIGSMGTDTPIAILSDFSRSLYDYFKQLFAQVSNPPLDSIREEMITSLFTRLGPEGNIFDPQPSSCRVVHLDNPVITNDELSQIVHISEFAGLSDFHTEVIAALYEVTEGGEGLRRALDELCGKVTDAVDAGAKICVISDRGSTQDLAPIPSLLAVSAVHRHLTRQRKRTSVGLVSEAGDVREIHHLCLHMGYGANAVNPYLAFETIKAMVDDGSHGLGNGITTQKAFRNFVEAAGAGILKVISKMGIATVASYTGAQIFEVIGLDKELVETYFTATPSRLGGAGLEEIAADVAARHRRAYSVNPIRRAHRTLEAGGEYQWRREGEYHLFNPETVFKLQHATRERRYDIFAEYTDLIDAQSRRLGSLRGLFRFRRGLQPAVPIEEVEPASQIFKRFSTGAMSYGSISAEAHETLAIAMNRIGGKSNTGEGGENPKRYTPDPNGDWRRSAIKQIASGRFGVTSEYLVNADDLQIKMAQGAKPGEGGQLPGHKVYPWIAETRYSTPGVGLISPAPHHDIYSIEDLAQLIYDLKNANSKARIHVKLVAEVGVGTVAAGVAKAHADVVLISGHDGGTGASPLTSIKHAGVPWELGLAETQQTLLLNNLRDRIVVQVDGQLKTGRDVVIATLLGAEEFGFATAPLVVMGCVMMRVCHLDTCPVGVATQNPELRRKFEGRAEFVVNFFEFIAQQVRTHLAELGFRSIEEAVGQVEFLGIADSIDHLKASKLDLTPLLHLPQIPAKAARHQRIAQDHGLDHALDKTLIELCDTALKNAETTKIEMPIRNTDRTVGTILGSEITKRYGAEGLPDNTIVVNFTGSAGASFGAFLPRGVTLRLEGDANDYLAKGLSGGRIAVKPAGNAGFEAEDNVIAGNVVCYGATSGEVFLNGLAGERFCVRNSGATAVVEGVGDHGCEYMTGGRVVILGPVGRNFGAGMSGGVTYVYDPQNLLMLRTNFEMVELAKLGNDDLIWLRTLVQRHHHETDSTVAARLLANWQTESAHFVKVMPTDYKRVLQAIEHAKITGIDEMEAVMASAHG